MTVEIYLDYVVIEKQRIVRPPHVSRTQWVEWWECANVGCVYEDV